jgi:hypothetical protein
MSGNDHGHGAGHGHDAHDGPGDIIPVGSTQDRVLGFVCLFALLGFCWWGKIFYDIGVAHQNDKPEETHEFTHHE